MKKFWIGLIGLIFISGLVLTQTPAEETAEQITSPAREMLLHQIEGIRGFVQTIGEKSGTVFKSDLSQLQKMIDNFFSLRKRLLEEMDAPSFIFTEKDASEIAFVFECQEMLSIYFEEGTLNDQDDKLQRVKRFFFKYAGREMTIEKAKDFGGRAALGFLMGIFVALIVGVIIGIIVAAITNDEDAGFKVGMWVCAIVYITWVLFCFLVF